MFEFYINLGLCILNNENIENTPKLVNHQPIIKIGEGFIYDSPAFWFA